MLKKYYYLRKFDHVSKRETKKKEEAKTATTVEEQAATGTDGKGWPSWIHVGKKKESKKEEHWIPAFSEPSLIQRELRLRECICAAVMIKEHQDKYKTSLDMLLKTAEEMKNQKYTEHQVAKIFDCMEKILATYGSSYSMVKIDGMAKSINESDDDISMAIAWYEDYIAAHDHPSEEKDAQNKDHDKEEQAERKEAAKDKKKPEQKQPNKETPKDEKKVDPPKEEKKAEAPKEKKEEQASDDEEKFVKFTDIIHPVDEDDLKKEKEKLDAKNVSAKGKKVTPMKKDQKKPEQQPKKEVKAEAKTETKAEKPKPEPKKEPKGSDEGKPFTIDPSNIV